MWEIHSDKFANGIKIVLLNTIQYRDVKRHWFIHTQDPFAYITVHMYNIHSMLLITLNISYTN